MFASLQLVQTVLLCLIASKSAQASIYPRQDTSSSSSASSSSSTTSASSSSASSTSSASSSSSSTTASSTASSDGSFPTDVGYAGTIKYGASPFLVFNDRINGSLGNSPIETRWNATDDTTFNIFQSVGNESPYFSTPLFADYQEGAAVLPEQCTVSQVHLLHRHGARYPTSSTTEGAPFFGATLANISKTTNSSSDFNATGILSFLNTWQYQLGAEVLVPVGTQELFDSGVHSFYRYGKLYNATTQTHKPVVRTTSEQRMLDSARFFNLGFFGFNASELVDLEVIIENGEGLTSTSSNNTLAPYDTCNNSDTITIGDTYLRPVWDPIYLANATTRLQQYVTGLNLTTELVYGMQSLCAYETVALGYSNFCPLFTKAEWEGYEYDLDLQFQGDYGFMSPTGRAQGIGWVQEFLDRVTNTTFSAANVTLQNTTLDSSSTYFPIDQPFYFDFTHDDVIVSVLTALNYTQIVGDYLNASAINSTRTFVLSQITPFAARLAFEIVECSNSTSTSNATQYIRTVLNDAVVPLNEGQGCTPSANGLCLLSDFVTYQQTYAVAAANFNKTCFGVNGTDFNITGPSIMNGTLY
ncbi:hypothetical protein CBS101457_004933 [Exobasidium rhododendri]|nr:hypothetical protein CBS101457_004933 [Exobasidium rhododendri]